jgi:hypothetical protein
VPLKFCPHSRQRIALRGIPEAAVQAALERVRPRRQSDGKLAYDVTPEAAWRCRRLHGWAHLRVVLDRGGYVITAYRIGIPDPVAKEAS